MKFQDKLVKISQDASFSIIKAVRWKANAFCCKFLQLNLFPGDMHYSLFQISSSSFHGSSPSGNTKIMLGILSTKEPSTLITVHWKMPQTFMSKTMMKSTV